MERERRANERRLAFFQPNENTENASRGQRRKKSLSNSARGWGPKRLSRAQGLTAHEQKGAGHGHNGNSGPIKDKVARRRDLCEPANKGRNAANRSIVGHDRCQSPPIERRTLHQRADDLDMLYRPIRFHATTL